MERGRTPRFGNGPENKVTKRDLIKLAAAIAALGLASKLDLLRHEFRGLNRFQRRVEASFITSFAWESFNKNQEGCVSLYTEMVERLSNENDPEYKKFLEEELFFYLGKLQEMENFEDQSLGYLVSELIGSFNRGEIDKEAFLFVYVLIKRKFPNSRHLPEMRRLLEQ